MKASRILIMFGSLALLLWMTHTPRELYAAVDDFNILLGRPSDDSITANVIPDQSGEISFEYGTTSGVYGSPTSAVPCTVDEPVVAVISGLESNTQYFYRLLYRATSEDSWTQGDEHSFYTQRGRGETFTFTIITDSHMNGGGGNAALYEQTIDKVRLDHPDFHFDLGDTFWMDGLPMNSTIANQKYLSQRQWMGVVSHSAAIFLAPGNHENEEGWNFDDTNSRALLSVNARKLYYPNPITDGFYSGNDDPLPEIYGGGLREDYFAWTWGDALFVFIDPYHYTMKNPYILAGGEDNDEDPASKDRWDWTLGQQQFNWFRQTIQNSHAKFKFVFAHHMLGGLEDFVRGGAAAAHMFEWGGYDIDGTTWGFNRERPGWGNVPIHQLMIANGVSAFFYGHDHLYAYQKRDGVVYQEVPSAGLTGSGLQSYYHDSYTLNLLPSPGYLRVTISPTKATVEYVYTTGELAHTYTIDPSVSLCQSDFAPSDGDVDGSDLAAYISDPGDIELENFAAEFGRTDCPVS